MKVAVHGYQVRPGCAFVLEWNLPFQNPGSATAYLETYRFLTITAEVCSCKLENHFLGSFGVLNIFKQSKVNAGLTPFSLSDHSLDCLSIPLKKFIGLRKTYT